MRACPTGAIEPARRCDGNGGNQTENLDRGATEAATAAVNGMRTVLATLQGLDPATLKAVLDAAASNNQINAAENSTAAAIVGDRPLPGDAAAVVSPLAPSPRLLDP